jgi:peptidoglycan/LPS O-acetylase OafA/YrhL
MQARETRIDDIELLRGIAVLLVVVHHVNGNLFVPSGRFLPEFFARFGGWVGVDLFFAISGFVIARSLLPVLAAAPDARARTAEIMRFWIRRAFRLLPAAWLWLGLILLLSIVFNGQGFFGTPQANLDAALAGALQFANLRFAEVFGLSFYGASFVYWSLSLEWQFYLALPLLAFAFRGWLAVVLLAWLLLLCLLPRGIWGMSFRTDAIAWGVLLALLAQAPRGASWAQQVATWRGIATLTALAGIAALALLGSPLAEGMPLRINLIAVVAAVVTAIAAADAGAFRWLCPGPLGRAGLWLGTRSYAVYLCHVPLMYLLREAAAREGFAPPAAPSVALLLYALLLGVFSEATFRLVEQPFRRLGHRVTQVPHHGGAHA